MPFVAVFWLVDLWTKAFKRKSDESEDDYNAPQGDHRKEAMG